MGGLRSCWCWWLSTASAGGETELRRLGCHQRGYRTAAASARGDECGGAGALCSAAHENPHGAPIPPARPRLVRATLKKESSLRTASWTCVYAREKKKVLIISK